MGPVIDKCATIIRGQIEGRSVDSICLVGGTACLTGIEGAIEKRLGIPVYKPKNPMFVTPLGIALSCKQEIMY
jgi:ethanolamine utilization protein EutJ